MSGWRRLINARAEEIRADVRIGALGPPAASAVRVASGARSDPLMVLERLEHDARLSGLLRAAMSSKPRRIPACARMARV